ncbi:hypothetical protein [Piscinibacter sp.]|jgi:tetratricopeptide (TPR) repeat protein|uniref:hypothetical protein n=1 Tax=Piscinibacter sp. TaxID=1903157 RepID=UPI00355A74A1
MNTMRHAIATLACVLGCAAAHAETVLPRSDAEVIETLPAAVGGRAEERRLRRDWAANPRDAAKAVALARHHLDQARSQGDPRHAGQALAVLQAWPDPAQASDDVLLLLATIEQYLHEFDASAAHLERLVNRRPQHAQAWLTLATVRRVQGRYADSDRACAALAATGAALYAQACQAENDGLRGDVDAARDRLRRLVAAPRLPSDSRNWLLTTLAELEARAGRPAEAEAAYRMAWAALPDAYTAMSFADFLMQQGRHADALIQLKGQPPTDAVLLRRAIAGTQAQSPDAPRDVREVRERMALANLRPDARTTHAREQAMFALWVDGAAQRAMQLARANVRMQREPLDLLLLAQAARATGDSAALREADAIRKEMGLHDQRLDALL